MCLVIAATSVELRLEENRRALEDLVGPAQTAVPALELLDPLALVGLVNPMRTDSGAK